MIFLAPAFLWLLAALPAVAVLHFLRTRRREQTVSALFLWEEAERHATEKRRFSLHWLLLLQLLAVAMLALLLARPVFTGRGEPDRVLVIDASASMAASDPDGVRLVKALAAAREFTGGRGRTAVIRAGLEPEVMAGLDAGTAELAVALAELRAADAGADLTRAVELGRSLAPDAELHVFSDSVPAGLPDVTWHQVTGSGHNLGITVFQVDGSQAFVGVSSSWPRPQLVRLSLEDDGVPAGETELLVPASGRAGTVFPLPDGPAGMFRAILAPPPGDALTQDDEAWAGSRQLTYFMLDASEPLGRALGALPGVDRAGSAASADVIVARTDTTLPDTMAAGHIRFAPPSPTPRWLQIRDWAAAHPLLRFTELQDVRVGLDPDPTAEPGTDGGEVLARASDLTPLITLRTEGGAQVVEFAFNPSQSDFIFRPAFPVLMANILDSFRGETAVPLGTALPPGTTLAGEPAERALDPGVYRTQDGAVITASLLSEAQTLLPGPGAPGTAGDRSGRFPAAAAGDLDPTPWLLGVLLVLLAAEGLLWRRFSPGSA